MPATCWSPSPSSTPEHAQATSSYVLAIVAVALIFDFINGFHDSANSIATVVSTRVLSPGVAVVWAAFFNFVAAFVVGTAVAKTIGKGLIDAVGGGPAPHPRRAARRDRLGPHHLVPRPAELVAPRAASAGSAARRSPRRGSPRCSSRGWVMPILFIFVSPLLGHGARAGRSPWRSRGCSRARAPGPVDRVFRRLQLLSAALYSLSHGANDAQKTMGIIVGPAGLDPGAVRRRDRAGCVTCTCRTPTGFRSGWRWRPTPRSASARRSAAGGS